MFRLLQFLLCLLLIILLQVSILPTYLEDSFKPNLIIILVCFVALRGENTFTGAFAAYFSGLINGVFSGLYFGLSGISCLLIYLFVRKISVQLYTENNQLMVVAVFLASLSDPLISLILITLLSAGSGIYGSIFVNLIPQAVSTSLLAALVTPAYSFFQRRFSN